MGRISDRQTSLELTGIRARAAAQISNHKELLGVVLFCRGTAPPRFEGIRLVAGALRRVALLIVGAALAQPLAGRGVFDALRIDRGIAAGGEQKGCRTDRSEQDSPHHAGSFYGVTTLNQYGSWLRGIFAGLRPDRVGAVHAA
jgi:hypothetical protein